MVKKGVRYSKALAVMLALLMVFTLAPQEAFAAGTDNGLEVEWKNQTNSDNNNCVIDSNTPTETKYANLKWGEQFSSGFAASITPPIIIGGYLYAAQGTKLHKINKETGKSEATATLAGNLGYALNSPTYGEGKIFFPIGNGRIQALDIDTLETLWVSESVGSEQTVSPITYKNGYVYTGTWKSETVDGSYFCVSADATKDVYDNNGTPTKKIQWKLQPSIGVTTADGVTSEGGVTSKSGFYWAGAYATDDYVVFGSDDGSAAYTYTDTAMLYSMHPTSGEVIATMGGIYGDIRSSILYDNGHIYFSTKGGHLYKVKMNGDGTFGKSSYINSGGMMTATPQKYGNRIYVGVSGASQFDPDSNHTFAVIRDDETLTQDSLISKVSIPGYPQASCVMSTKHVTSTGDLYIYFTYNARPGGIYCVKDNINSTSPEAFTLFTPPSEMQQFCISTLAADSEGTLYHKNDSGYLMAIETNDAFIEDITVTPDTGKAQWTTDFSASEENHSVKVSSSSKSAAVELKLPEGVTATVNGESYTGKYVCDLSEGQKELTIVTSKGSKSRTYTLSVICKSTDSMLSEIKVTTSNSYTGTELPLNSEFNPNVVNHKTQVLTNSVTFTRLWPTSANKDAEIKVYPIENVSNGSNNLNEDGTIKGIPSSQRYYYPVYFTAGETYSKVRVQVISEDGEATSNYYVTIHRDPSISSIGEPNVEISKQEITIYAKGPGSNEQLFAKVLNYSGKASWESDNPTVATVNSKGLVEGLSPGTTVVRADCGKASAECTVTVKAPTLELNTDAITLNKSSNPTATLTAKVNGVANQTVNWTVTRGSDVVSVDSAGVVTAKNVGTAEISAEFNDVKKTCFVTVVDNTENQTVLGESASPTKAAPKSFKATSQKKKAKLSWKKTKDISKYQVAYKQKGSKKWKYKTVAKDKKSVVIKKLKGNKKYQFKIRTYKKVNGEKKYSKWSKTKTIKIKK